MKNKAFTASVIATISAFLVEVVILILFRETWFDELLYSFKGYLIASGTYVPFTDIVVEYPPLFIPIYGIPQILAGPSLYLARIVSTVILGLMLTSVYIVGKKLGNSRWWGIGAVWLLMSNVFLMGNYVSGTLYSLTALLLTLAFWVETLSTSRSKKALYSGVVLGLLLLARINMLPAILVYGGYLLYRRVGMRDGAIFLASLAVTVIIGYAPLVYQNPSLAFSHILAPFVKVGPLATLPATAVVGGQAIVEYVQVFVDLVREFFAFFVLFFTVLAFIVRQQWGRIIEFIQEEHVYALLVALSTGLFAAHYLYWGAIGQVGYAAYFMPLVALTTMVGCARYVGEYRPFAAIVVGVAIALGAVGNLYRSDVLSSPREESDILRVSRGAELIRAHTEADARVLSFDNSFFHVFLAGKTILAPLVNRDFFYVHFLDTERARQLRFYNYELLKEWILSGADYIALNKEFWNLQFVRGSFWGSLDPDGRRKADEIRGILDEEFELIASVNNVYPRKYTKGEDGGTLELYKRLKQ
ncbi:MAG: glycosyltransferase family 39 protein [Candidatus Vogelbacteria bacterium]|nr:glycosyltransferase family 39 protein [Candidatus Vogelbacteria bacterium]